MDDYYKSGEQPENVSRCASDCVTRHCGRNIDHPSNKALKRADMCNFSPDCASYEVFETGEG